MTDVSLAKMDWVIDFADETSDDYFLHAPSDGIAAYLDWPWDFYQPMADAGFIADVADEKWGGTTIPDDQKAKGDRLIAGAIEALRVPEGTENPDA